MVERGAMALAMVLAAAACGNGSNGRQDGDAGMDPAGEPDAEVVHDVAPEAEDPVPEAADPDAAHEPDGTGDVIEEEAPEELCPEVEGGISWAMPGDFVPSTSEPTRTCMIDCTGGLAYSAIVVEFDLTHAGWYAPDPDGTHGIFQLTRSTRWRSNLYGYMTMFGPARNEVKVISNIDLGAGEVVRLNRTGIAIAADATYHVRYTYDTAAHERRLLVTSGRETVLDISDASTVDEVSTLGPGFQVILATDHAGSDGPEVPTYGWRYANMCIQVLP